VLPGVKHDRPRRPVGYDGVAEELAGRGMAEVYAASASTAPRGGVAIRTRGRAIAS
jgi:hypothetical protein